MKFRRSYSLIFLFPLFRVSIATESATPTTTSFVKGGQKDACTAGRDWRCAIRNMSEEPAAPSAEALAGDGDLKIADFDVFYLNRANALTGELYVSATIVWRFTVLRRPKSSYSFQLSIVSRTRGLKNVRFTVLLTQANKSAAFGPDRGEVRVRLNNPQETNLFFGHSYDFQISEERNVDGKHPEYIATAGKVLTIPALYPDDDVSGCLGHSFIGDLHRKQLASRWTLSLHEIVYLPIPSNINLTFFGAPPSHCIEKYVVQLWFQDAILSKTKSVEANQLTRTQYGTMMGHVFFEKLQKGANYTIRIIPQEHTAEGECVCQFNGECGCVSVKSEVFSVPSEPIDEKVNTFPPHPPPSIVGAGDEGDKNNFLYMVVAALLLLCTLILLTFALLLLILRNSSNSQPKKSLFLVFNGGRSRPGDRLASNTRPLLTNDVGSLMRECSSVLLLNAELERVADVEFLANILTELDITVRYDRWECKAIEENLQLWVHSVLTNIDKVVIFHGDRASSLITTASRSNSTLRTKTTKRELFDDVFHAIYSCLNFASDARIVHARWSSNDRSPPITRAAENVYIVARDLRYLLTALGGSLPDDRSRKYQEEYLRLNEKKVRELSRNIDSNVVDDADERNTENPISAESVKEENRKPLTIPLTTSVDTSTIEDETCTQSKGLEKEETRVSNAAPDFVAALKKEERPNHFNDDSGIIV